MARIELETEIAAPPERCFDLSLSVELHLDSTARRGERVLVPHLTRLLRVRGDAIRRAAEGEEWRRYLET